MQDDESVSGLRLCVTVTPENLVLCRIVTAQGEERGAIAFDPEYAKAASEEIQLAAIQAERRKAAH